MCRRHSFSAHRAVTGHKIPKKLNFLGHEPKNSFGLWAQLEDEPKVTCGQIRLMLGVFCFVWKIKKSVIMNSCPQKSIISKFPKKSCVLASSMRIHRFRKAPKETFFSPVFCNVCDTCHLNQKSLFSSTPCAYTLITESARVSSEILRSPYEN